MSRVGCYYRLAFCTHRKPDKWPVNRPSVLGWGEKIARRGKETFFLLAIFSPFPQTKSLFTGYLISYGLTALVELYSTDNEVACVAGVERGRGRGNLGAREGERKERKERFPSSLLPRAWSRALIPFPFPSLSNACHAG